MRAEIILGHKFAGFGEAGAGGHGGSVERTERRFKIED